MTYDCTTTWDAHVGAVSARNRAALQTEAARLRWDDGVAYDAQFVTERFMHAHEVTDAELSRGALTRTEARRFATVEDSHGLARHSLGVGRVAEPQPRMFLDNEGLRHDSERAGYAQRKNGRGRTIVERMELVA